MAEPAGVDFGSDLFARWGALRTRQNQSDSFVSGSWQINRHRMVLPVKPTAECIKTAVLRPSLFIGQPTSQLLDENLLAQFAQELMNVLF
jgi:hypothetical protein